jgi:tRNA threonylcarbamoyladenosine biosynthesis protein TsaB
MSYLFVDTSDHLVLGLLDSNYEWIELVETNDKKSSASIHAKIYELLKRHDLKIKDVKALFQVAGPGSYTGMRISEGISQVLEWQKMPIYSFYHFVIPSILGESKGAWISRAFKGEIFLYEWRAGEVKTSLHDESELPRIESELKAELGEFWTHYNESFPEIPKSTGELLKNNSQKLFSYVADSQLREKPFYYRSLEKEFTVSQKS